MVRPILIAFLAFAACPCPAAVPILVYHRFAPAVADSMKVTTRALDSGVLPPASLVITADDGHESIYTELIPRLERSNFPAALLIYPSAISNAKWAMTWPELLELGRNPLFDIESDTYGHHTKSRMDLEQKLSKKVNVLSWPFGICDDRLIAAAEEAGYRAAFTLERRSPARNDRPLALPRYLMTDSLNEKFLARATQDSRP